MTDLNININSTSLYICVLCDHCNVLLSEQCYTETHIINGTLITQSIWKIVPLFFFTNFFFFFGTKCLRQYMIKFHAGQLSIPNSPVL